MTMKITVDLNNEEIVNMVIRNYTEEVLKMSLEVKQQFLVRNGLAGVVDNSEPPMPDPQNAGDSPTVDLSNPVPPH